MVVVKANNGRAARHSQSLTKQLVAVFVFAVIAVSGVKTLGTASWHAGATMDDHQIQRAEINAQDTNLMKFVFANLDGEEGHEGTPTDKCFAYGIRYDIFTVIAEQLMTNTL